MIYEETSPRPSAVPEGFHASESVWNSRVQWGAILAGAFAGLGVTIIMATIGGAIGMTAGAAGMAGADTANSETAKDAAVGFGIGAGVWLLLTALATGLVGGWALNATARRDRAYSSVLFGGIAWSVGICLLLAIAGSGLGGVISGMGAGAGNAATAIKQRSGVGRVDGRASESKSERTMTDQEKAAALDAAEKAAKTAATAAWFGLGAQLLGLIATMLAAGRNRHTGARVVTEIRPRPAPTA